MKLRKLSLLLVFGALLGLGSCMDWDRWDPEAGNQKNPEPEPPAVGVPVYDPTVAFDGVGYYVVSSNSSLDGITNSGGLLMQKSSDLITFDKVVDESVYILNDVVKGWAASRIKELDPSVADESIVIGQPCLRKVGDEWRLYYSVCGGTNASVIGYATSSTLENATWTDKGEILSSSPTSAFCAHSPSFFTSSDGAKYYMAYGYGAAGIYIDELDVTTGKPKGSATLVAQNSNGYQTEAANVFYYEGLYYLLFTMKTGDGIWRTYQTFSANPMGDYADVAGRSAIFSLQYALTSVITDYLLLDAENSLLNISGFDLLLDGSTGFAVHHGKQGGLGEAELYVRKLHWVGADSRRTQSPDVPLLGFSPEVYKGNIDVEITPDYFVGKWQYGTQWAHIVNEMSNAMEFYSDGTYSGGSWDFDYSTNILHLNSTEWSGEDAYLYCFFDTDNVRGGYTLVACGYNDVFTDYPGAWMKKSVSYGTGGGDEEDLDLPDRNGFLSPAMAYDDGMFYLFNSNAIVDGVDFERGIYTQSTDELGSEFFPDGYILSDVLEEGSEAYNYIYADSLNSGCGLVAPTVRKIGSEWRLYYSIYGGSKTAAIGYATASSPAGPWTDKGMIIKSNSSTDYVANNPSLCVDGSNSYLAFGEETGIFVAQLNSDGSLSGDPKKVVSASGNIGSPEMFSYDGKFYILYSVDGYNTAVVGSSSATEGYTAYAGTDAVVNVLSGYAFGTGVAHTGLADVSLFDYEGKTIAIHNAGTETEYREMYVLNNSEINTATGQIIPAFAPAVYDATVTSEAITEAEVIEGQWSFGLLNNVTATGSNALGDKKVRCLEGGTCSVMDGTWTFDSEAQTLHITTADYDIYLKLMRIYDTDNSIHTIAGAGVDNNTKTGVMAKRIEYVLIPAHPAQNTPVYFNSFEYGLVDASIYGGGSLATDATPNFGQVFQNAAGGMRQNYLLLPEDVLSWSDETKQMSIGVWVNAKNAGTSATYMWSPLFTAYGSGPNAENTFPMMALQYRGVCQVNCNGWTDFTDAENVAGVNTLYHDATDWLADGNWHYYSVTFTSTSAKVYFDGVVANEWTISGGLDGLFSNGADLKYICLGGNQAWTWGDPDPGFMFDDIAIYNVELSKSDIDKIIASKNSGMPSPVYYNSFEYDGSDVSIYGGGSFVDSGDAGFNRVFQNAAGGMRQNYLLLPEDALSHSVDTKAMTVSVWVNAKNAGTSATYMWSPLFTAYGSGPNVENTFPMMALQYRGVCQVNCNGWTDFTDAENVAGVNTLYHDATDWLADGNWHHYSATFTSTSAKVYIDGVVANEWTISGGLDGLFSNGADLKYICLGGNQAWTWGDPDPGFMFDDIAIYNEALTADQIKALINSK